VSAPVYFIGWSFFRIIFRIFGRVKVSGLKNIPAGSGCIIASNHISNFDPPLVGSSLNKRIYYMGKKELFENPVFAWVLRQMNVFPVNREGSDHGAIRTALKILSGKKILLMFPQGTRMADDGDLLNFKGGIGFFACRARVPVVPCLVQNTEALFPRRRMRVTFGEPVYPPAGEGKQNKEAARFLAEEVIAGIKKLKGSD